DGVGHELERVGCRLQLVDDLLELQHGQSVVGATEQPCEQTPMDLVRLVLQAVDLDPVVGEVVHRPQPRHGVSSELPCALQHPHLLGDVGWQIVQLVQRDQVGGRVHTVQHVVEGGGQAVDVL